MALSLFTACFGVLSVSAEENGNTVRVTVENRVFTGENAAWQGVLLESDIALGETDSLESVIERAVTANGYDFTVSNYGYISSINGLAEYAANGNGGWMATLNDWFTADGTTAYTVQNGGLQAGDEIVMMYTCSWGADVGSIYGNFDTYLNNMNISGELLSGDMAEYLNGFTPENHEYTVKINAPEAVLDFDPEAYNKNYQVRTYLNEYLPAVNGADYRGGKNVPVKDGDTVYIGVGNPVWPSMNSWSGTAEETVYTFNIQYVPVNGDINADGKLTIDDITLLQRYLAEFITLSDEQLALADVNGDETVNVNDVTSMQRTLAGL